MQVGLAQCVNKGMQRDYSMDKASQEFAYENRNIRITTNGDNSFLSVSNEKSTIECSLDKTIEGVILGSATIGDYLVLFVKNNTQDSIYKIKFNDSTGEVVTLYQSTEDSNNLNFDINNPIECITSYEGDEVQKVYWVDGKNQPRFINIFPDTTYPSNSTFDFSPICTENTNVTIEKEYNGLGNFKSGIIQYFVTYYKKFGAETNIVFQSPLYYISPKNRGGEVNEDQTCNFKITIIPETDKFDFVRVYSLVRTSTNISQVFLVGDTKLQGVNVPVSIIDTNNGIPMEDTELLFLGGNTIIAHTIEQKDNTLFLGNIESTYKSISSDTSIEIKNEVKDISNIEIGFGTKIVKNNDYSNNEYYSYSPNMDVSSEESTTFKYGEYYRFGIQFQLNTLEWTPTYYIGDFQNNISLNNVDDTSIVTYNPYIDKDDIDTKSATMVYAKLSKTFIESLKSRGFISWRLMVVPHTPGSRTIKAQGLVTPTLFNLKQRYKNQCYGSPIWTLGQCQQAKHFVNVDASIDSEEALKEDTVDYLSPLNTLPTTIKYLDVDEENKILNNIVSNAAEEKTYKSLQTVSLTIGVTRDYNSAQDRFYGKIKIGVFDSEDHSTKVYKLNKKTSGGYTEKIAEVGKLFGQRKKGCKELSKKLKNLIWEDLKDCVLNYESTSDQSEYIYIKDLEGIDLNSRVFLSGEVPSGEKIRSWVTPSNTVEKHCSTGVRDVSFTVNEKLLENYENDYFVDANLCNFISPDAENVNEFLNFRIIGYTDINNSISDYNVNVKDSIVDGTVYEAGYWNFNNNKYKDYFTGITSYPIWPFSNRLHFINYWQQNGYIVKTNKTLYDGSTTDKLHFELSNKKFANMWFMQNTQWLDTPLDYGQIDYIELNNNTNSIIGTDIYNSNYEYLLFPKDIKSSKIAIKENKDNTDPINSSYDLKYINDILTEGTDFAKLKRNNESLLITHSSSEHVVFKLPEEFTVKEVLPNYNNNIIGNSDIFGNRNTQILDVDNFIYLSNTPFWYEGLDYEIDRGTIDGKMALEITRDSYNKITSMGVVWYRSWPIRYGSSNIHPDEQYIVNDCNPNIYTYYFLNNEDTYFNSVYGYDFSNYLGKNIVLYFKKEEDYYFIYIKNINSSPIFDVQSRYLEYKIEYMQVFKNLDKVTFRLSSESYILDSVKQNYQLNFKEQQISHSKNTDVDSKYWVGEFYTPYDPSTFMGGNNDNAIEQNVFIPISGKYSFDLEKDENDNPLDYSLGYGLEGDTYYQRWDHVRLYPKNKENVNQNTDALSIMLETYKNLDADYRKFRGRLDTTTLTVDNTNDVLNPIYNQRNNYITSTVLDEKYDDSTHPTLFTWSLTKQPLSDIDIWTSTNLTRASQLDGDKGVLTKIKKWNNQLLVFQEKGLAVINFNQQTAISTDSGVPVEIAASGLVSGHYYISSTQGCKNKWSIVDSPYGVYFIDSYNKSINLFNSESIKSLSTINLFEDWIRENEKGHIWNPSNIQGFKSFYDPIHKEVYFANNKEALCYNELLNQFTSFYNYGSLNTMTTINGHTYGIKNNSIHKMFEGDDYCNLFGEQEDYSITYKVNKDPFVDKTWTNIEYRADIFNSGNIGDNNSTINIPLETFDTLEVWNEYQKGTTDLSKARCKFRIWRADIPRDTSEGKGLNRIRNPWIMLKLTKNSDSSSNRMEFHDLLVKYLQ